MKELRPEIIRYDIVDFGISCIDEWHQRFGGNIFEHRDANRFLEVICFPGGTGALLKKNLVDRQLQEYVTLIILGDIKDYRANIKYDFIFCDCSHGLEEIEKNIPLVANYLNLEFILACDDIHTEEECEVICRLTGADSYYMSRRSEGYSKIAVFTKGAGFYGFLGE